MERSASFGVIMPGMVNAFQRTTVISGYKAAFPLGDIGLKRWVPLTRFFDMPAALTRGDRDFSPFTIQHLFRKMAGF